MFKITMNRVDLFLICLSFIYLSAFSSLLIQSKGLYGDNGVLPTRRAILNNPSLLINNIYHKTESHVDDFNLLIILGLVISSLAFIFDSCRTKFIYFCLWALYFSIFQIGQTFLWFQWDILLLETGIIAIILPRHWIFGCSVDCHEEHSSNVAFWLVKWLIFRLMFASGVVKLTSNCPTWWGLTALNWHYESQCIPTFLAWFAHQLPYWFQSLSVVATYFIEIMIPIIFFIPMTTIQWFCFCSQLLLQILIILSGNYNFFNLLTVSLCVSLLPRLSKSTTKTKKNHWFLYVEGILSTIIIGWFVHKMVYYFGIEFDAARFVIKTRINFTNRDFRSFLEKFVPATLYVGALSLLAEIVGVLLISIRIKGIRKKVQHCIETMVISVVVVGIFCASLVPYTTIDSNTHERLPASIKQLYEYVKPYEIVNSYGLFRSMTGVGGRPEIIIEGSNSINGPWQEFEFLYKPGNLSRPPPFIIPHQPRLDWQMWFAALGSYQHNPWFINLLYRILTNEKSVIELLDKNPFGISAPKYVRVNLYHYHYTSYQNWSSSKAWWQREFIKEYLPALSKDSEGLMQYIRDNDLQFQTNNNKAASLGIVKRVVRVLMDHINQSHGHLFVWAVLVVNVAAKYLARIIANG